MFIKILDEVSNQVECEIGKIYRCPSNNIPFETKLHYAIIKWSRKLSIHQDYQDITDYILKGSQLYEVKKIMTYIWQEGIAEKKPLKISNFLDKIPITIIVENQLYQHINALFNRMNKKHESMKFIVIIGFVITAVGYWLYRINQEEQKQQTFREEPIQYIPNFPSQNITGQSLVLVVSALQAGFLESLKAKRYINFSDSDGEALYEITKYLLLGSEDKLRSKIRDNTLQYSVSKGEESEYDIYLVYVELKQTDEGFKPNKDQADRYDAFRKLTNLAVKVEVSPRLRMEAYGNIGVYSC